MQIIGFVLLWTVMLGGLASIPFGMPGTFIIAADALIYGLITGFEKITMMRIAILFVMAVGMEVLEEIFSGMMARRFGGSKRAWWGALGGGFLGAIWGTPLFPVFGTLVGGFAGAALGAFFMEWIRGTPFSLSVRVGAGALVGAISGKITKIVVAVIMIIIVASSVHRGI